MHLAWLRGSTLLKACFFLMVMMCVDLQTSSIHRALSKPCYCNAHQQLLKPLYLLLPSLQHPAHM